jgi:lysozyme
MAALSDELLRDEGFKQFPYHDTVGKLTIGIGRNLVDVGVTAEEAVYLAQSEVGRCEWALDREIPWWRTLTPARQRALLNMAYNLGVPGLMKFKNFIGALKCGHYEDAHHEMLNSKWAQQVGDRATRLAQMIITGGV